MTGNKNYPCVHNCLIQSSNEKAKLKSNIPIFEKWPKIHRANYLDAFIYNVMGIGWQRSLGHADCHNLIYVYKCFHSFDLIKVISFVGDGFSYFLFFVHSLRVADHSC